MNINTLLNQIRDKEIVLPGIQRDFVWSHDKITKLLDSLMRGYPIGITLLWETYEDIQYRLFEGNYVEGNLYTYNDNSIKKKIKLVLDGQQRLQSLYISLYGKYDDKFLYFDIFSGRDSDDLAEEKYMFEFSKPDVIKEKNAAYFENNSKKEAEEKVLLPSYYVKVFDLFSMNAYQKKDFIKAITNKFLLSDKDEVRAEVNISRLDEALTKDDNLLKSSIIDENLTPDSPYRKSPADVLEIFVRVNTAGTPLSRSDLIFSMLKLNWKESAEILPFFIRNTNEGNSFEIDTDFVIRCLFAVSDLGTRFNLDVLRKKSNVEKLRNNFDQCCDSIKSTLDFVQRDCRCESSKLIGGYNSLLPLVYYLYNINKHQVSNNQLDNVKKSFYLISMGRPFSRYADSRLQRFLRSVLKERLEKGDKTFPLEDTVQWIEYWEKCETLEHYMQRNVPLTLHLIQGLTGAKVQYQRNSPEIDHIFPRSELRKKKYDESLINHYANFWILSKDKNRNKSNRHPSNYFKDVSDKVLKEALIERNFLDYRRYRTFLKHRAVLLHDKIQSMMGITDDDLSGLIYEE